MKSAGFYEAIAQVLPLIATLLLFGEVRIFQRPLSGPWRTATLVIFCFAALAEFRALYALWSENRWAADYLLLVSPLAFLLGLMFAFAFYRPQGQDQSGN